MNTICYVIGPCICFPSTPPVNMSDLTEPDQFNGVNNGHQGYIPY